MIPARTRRIMHLARRCAGYGWRHLLQSVDSRTGAGFSVPDRVGFTLTHRCNCRCVMCHLWKLDDAADELTPARWISLMEELCEWAGTFRLALNGGEIFLKPGVYDILKRAAKLGLTVNPVSNGRVFRSAHHFRMLLESGIPAITFSLDGKDPEIHDRLRGVPGLHSGVAEVIRRIKKEKPELSVSVICIIMRETAAQLAEFARWAEEIGVDNVLFQPIAEAPGVPEKHADWHRQSELFVHDLTALRSSIDGLIRLKAESGRIELPASTLRRMQEYFVDPGQFQIQRGRCRLGVSDLRINPAGVVYLCDVRHTAIGHVSEGPLKRIWWSERARAVRRAMSQCRRPCSALCHRSPGLLEKAAGFLRYARANRV